MTYNAAVKILKSEMEFLNMNWAQLRDMLTHNPQAFPLKAREAMDVVDKEASKYVD